MASEVTVALLMSVALNLSPSITTNTNKMAESPINQEPREMQISFIKSSSEDTIHEITRTDTNCFSCRFVCFVDRT